MPTPKSKPVLPREKLWSIAPLEMESIRRAVVKADLSALFPPSDPQGYEVQSGTAVIDICGVLEKSPSIIGWLFNASSMAEIRAQLKEVVDDPSISRIVLRIDSPGGTVAGTDDLAQDVRRAADVKEVIAFIEDQCCSAAYWIASQANQIYANRSATIGSIGTFLCVEDWSVAYEGLGVHVHLVKAGRFKGIGVPGTSLTADQREHLQENVDRVNDVFLSAVRSGRGLSSKEMVNISTAALFVGRDAIDVGLIDGIRRFEDVLAGNSSIANGSYAATRGRSAKTSGQQSGGTKGKVMSSKATAGSGTKRKYISPSRRNESVQKWDRVVASYVRQGMSKTEAISRAAKTHPNLRQRIVNEANRRR